MLHNTNNVTVSLQMSKIDINWTNATRIFLIFCDRQVTPGKKNSFTEKMRENSNITS